MIFWSSDRLSQQASKPCLLVRSKIDNVIGSSSFDGNSANEEEILQSEYNGIERTLNKFRVCPKNKSPLLVDFRNPDKYDFKELEALIKSKDLSGNSIPLCPSLLEVPEKFKSHYKIIIDGLGGTGKTSLINALRGKTAGSDGFIKVDENKKITFYEYGDNIVLCEMANEIINRKHFMCGSRYENYDCVVILTDTGASYKGAEYDFIKFAQNANKPYFLVRNKMDNAIDDAAFDGRTEAKSDIIQLEYDGIAAILKEKELDKCESNLQKPLLVSVHHCNEYDFRELEALIKSKDFKGRSLSNES